MASHEDLIMNRISFDRPLLYPPEYGDTMWELAADWRIVFEGRVYRIPAGFRTDGASIPRPLWRICGTPLEAPRVYAALVHDWLYSGGDPDVTRAEADRIYRDLLIALGVSKVKAYVEWSALRLCGWTHWKGRKIYNDMD